MNEMLSKYSVLIHDTTLSFMYFNILQVSFLSFLQSQLLNHITIHPPIFNGLHIYIYINIYIYIYIYIYTHIYMKYIHIYEIIIYLFFDLYT